MIRQPIKIPGRSHSAHGPLPFFNAKSELAANKPRMTVHDGNTKDRFYYRFLQLDFCLDLRSSHAWPFWSHELLVPCNLEQDHIQVGRLALLRSWRVAS